MGAPSNPLRMYHEFSDWWTLLSPPGEYEEEAALYRRTIVEMSVTPPRTVLELGSGGGNNASYLKRAFQMTLVDRSPGMLAVSRKLNPDCEHVEGDMRTVRLGRVFDFLRETFRPVTEHDGYDGDDRAMRYIAWTWDPDPADTTFVVDYAYLLRGADGTVRVEHDRHIEGLFARADWVRLLEAAGFEDVRVVPGDLSDLVPGQYELFVARKRR